MHTQKALAAQIVRQGGDYIFPVQENQLSLSKNIQPLFAPEHPKAGFGKIPTDFLTVEKVNKRHERLEKRILTTSEMFDAYSTWPGLTQVIAPPVKWNSRSPVCPPKNHTRAFVRFSSAALGR